MIYHGFVDQMNGRRRLATLWLVLWLASLVFPAVTTGPRPGDVAFGLHILGTGWIGILIYQFGWLANVVFLLILVQLYGRHGHNIFDVSLALAMVIPVTQALMWRKIQSGGPAIQSFGPGYYFWLAAMIGAAVTIVWGVKRTD
jgi:hypothetical protein